MFLFAATNFVVRPHNFDHKDLITSASCLTCTDGLNCFDATSAIHPLPPEPAQFRGLAYALSRRVRSLRAVRHHSSATVGGKARQLSARRAGRVVRTQGW